MIRLNAIAKMIVDSGLVTADKTSCHVIGSTPQAADRKTQNGKYLLDDAYSAQIHISYITDEGYRYLRVLLADWMKLNKVEEEELQLSSDPIDDIHNMVVIDLTLKESEHMVPDPEGKIEVDGQRWTLAEPDEGAFI